jgi:hypothetical protein
MTGPSKDWQGRVDTALVQTLAASNGLNLTEERAADLVPALQVILDFDVQLRDLGLGAFPVVGLPWGDSQETPTP